MPPCTSTSSTPSPPPTTTREATSPTLISIQPLNHSLYQNLTDRITETHHIRPLQEGSSLLPGVYVVYDFSPLRSVIKETHLPLFELCTSLCAILGGVFTVMGMIDSFFYSVGKQVKRKSKSTETELVQRVSNAKKD